MQPNQDDNYWEKETDETVDDKPSEIYEPDQDTEEPVVVSKDADVKSISSSEEPVHWTAMESVDNEKNGMWFVYFAIVVLGLIAVDIFFLKAYTFSALVIVMALTIIVVSRRPPREISYTLSGDQGLYIGEKLYHFSEFKAFGVINDSGHDCIMMIPVKRFALGVSVYFPAEVGEEIVDILGARLPMQDLKLDMIDKIVRKLRI